MQTVIPMKGRMIHHIDGKLNSQLYDRDGQVNYPFLVSRQSPNMINVILRPLRIIVYQLY